MSAAKAACDHMRNWWMGTPEGEYVSMAVFSAKNSYGIDENLMFSFPCTVKDKTWTIVSVSILSLVKLRSHAARSEILDKWCSIGIYRLPQPIFNSGFVTIKPYFNFNCHDLTFKIDI